MAEPRDPPQSKPTIFILNLDKDESYDGMFDAMYSGLIESLVSTYRIQRARNRDAAKRYLSNSENRPAAVLVVDPGAVKGANVSVLNQVKEYVRAGGTVVFAACFSSFMRPNDMNKLWKNDWDLNWKFGDYHRTDVHLNRYSSLSSSTSLPTSYSQKAVFLKNVAPSDSLYLPSPESRTQSFVFPAESVDQGQTPVALTKLGQGWLAYLGDVNNESGSQRVVMELCRFAASHTA